MQPRIHVLTLAVHDLERSLAFYRALGLASEGVIGTEFVGDETNASGVAAMFHLEGGFILALYVRADLAKDAGIPDAAHPSGAFSIGHGVRNREDVDALLSRAAAAGGAVPDATRDRPWGIYSGYFADPDGHLWEIMWNPTLELSPR